jgi:fucose permease
MDRLPIDRFRFAAGLLGVGALAYPLLATGRHGAMIVGALLAYAAGWSWPGVVHLGTIESNPAATGAASGVVQAGMFTGAMTGPALFGVIADLHGFDWAWLLSCGCSALGMILIAGGAALHRRPRISR